MPVTVVTGAGSGIGRATARRFASKGSLVVVSDIDERTGEETVALIESAGGRAVFRRLDVADAAAWADFTEWVCAEHGVPDVLVNNAGIGIVGGFLEQTGADWRRMIATNLMSQVIGSRLFVQRMIESGKRGHIVNVCSAMSFLPGALVPSYSTAKAGAWFATQALRAEFGPQGIGVSAVCPGAINTNIYASATRGGVSEQESADWVAETSGVLRRYIRRSPDQAAAAIERAVRWNISTLPIGAEAWAFWYLSRLSPALTRGMGAMTSMSVIDSVIGRVNKIAGGAR